MKRLRYDDKRMFARAAGEGGARASELKALDARLREGAARVKALRVSREQRFFNLPMDKRIAGTVTRRARALRRKFDRLIVIGIGGSDLGARTIIDALGSEAKRGMEVRFLGNPDPELLAGIERTKEWWEKTAVCVVSKSGTTLETMSSFAFVREKLERAVGRKAHAEHVIAITDPTEDSVLYAMAQKEGYELLDHPLNVGGRFSVLSAVGLFPAACAGIDPAKLLAGAATVERAHRRKKQDHEAVRFAGLHYLAMKKRGQRIHVVMPYAERLSTFGDWFRQIWAESLGKDGKGPTPVSALGTVDQHSQIQLYNGGPNDKVVTFIKPAAYASKARVPKTWKSHPRIGYMAGLDFERIMHAELEGTAGALAKHERPSGILEIPRIDEESLGALFMFFEIATAYMGELMAVNAYDQPGVEEGKKRAKALLS